ncbi:MAG TPA: methyltransferase domain-containing protein [Longimicrobiales bacterium]|nr:methyltransferase domain-containing protein [Longimicrobiales bacterium]
MRAELLSYLACPVCGGELDLEDRRVEGEHIMVGSLACPPCRTDFPVLRGVPRFTSHSSGHKATAAAFGYQWARYSELSSQYRRQFLDWIAPVEASSFRDCLVLEGGCGKGRHTVQAAEFGARGVLALDVSDAVDVAFANTRDLPNAHVVQADLNHPPVRRVFDLAFSVGVLHHLPEPERGFRALVSRLKPGGRIVVWVYGREGNGWIVHLISPAREHFTSRLPHWLLEPIALAATMPLFLVSRTLYRRKVVFGRRLPYAEYLNYIAQFPFKEQRTIVFDHLVAPVAYYLRRDEVEGWIQRAGLECVSLQQHNGNSWRALSAVPVGKQDG